MQSPAGDKLSQARDKVLKDIQQSAENQGADAVIGVRVLYQDTTGGVLVTVSGTAIQLATHSSSDDLPSTTNPDDEQSVVESDPDQVSAEGSNTDDHKRLACPSCGSTNVTSIEVFDRKHPESVKVKSGGCGGCMGCLVVILLVVLLWPVLVAIGIGGGILGALGLRGLDGFIRDNLPLVIGGVVVAIVVTALIKASQPKYVCEKCGNKWK
jgi:DNA-directed RNA polymerase subunit M/transcription elongation factor TFIIS